MAAVMSPGVDELACVLVPVGDTQLLLPNVTVAEVLPWRRVKPIEGAPAWCLGLVGWRGESIPVIRFELLNGGADPTRRTGRCLAIMNRAGRPEGVPFYAVAADHLPRLVHLYPEDVRRNETRLGAASAMAIDVGTEQAVIPDLERVETAINALMRRAEP